MALSTQQKKTISSLVPGKLLRYLYAFKKVKAIHLKELKLIYIPIPKAANRSIKTALAEKTQKKFEQSAHKADWDFTTIRKVGNSPFFSFTVVRNPLDRLLSCYIQKTKKRNFHNNFWKYGNLLRPDMSFEDFVDFVCNTPDYLADRHFKSQHLFLQYNNNITVDFIGKVENLSKDWEFLSAKFSLPPIPHLNQSKKGDLANYYTLNTALKVKNRYKKDINLLGYNEEVNFLINSLK